MEEEEEKQMINHISPFYSIAAVCAVLCVIVLIIGICLIDWEMVYLRHRSRQYRRQAEKNRYDTDWIDFDKWGESK